jgi:prevent-host-death family protein
MATMTTSAAHEDFGALLDRVVSGKERIILQRDDRPVAAIIPIEDLERLERLIEEEEDEDRMDLAEHQRIMADPNEEFIPWEQAKRELDL